MNEIFTTVSNVGTKVNDSILNMLSPVITKDMPRNPMVVGENWDELTDFYSDFLTKRGKARFERLLMSGGGEGDIRAREIKDIFNQVFKSAGRSLRLSNNEIIEFDPQHPRLIKWMEDRTLLVVDDISIEASDRVKVIIREATVRGDTEAQIAQRIKQVVGLNKRQSTAYQNFRKKQIENGVPKGRATKNANAYAKRLVKQRAETIARHEVQMALEEAKLEYWRQAADAGLIRRGDSWRIWRTHPDERLCPFCQPMEGKRTRIGGVFYTKLGKVPAPPLHVNCRCWTELTTKVLLEKE